MLKLKVCGLNDPKNINELILLKPDMIGLIFHEGSPRNMSDFTLKLNIPQNIKKVGVFVDSDPVYVSSLVELFGLNAIQLYHEDLKPFQKLREKVKLIKALPIGNKSDILRTGTYLQDCDLFLFDTKGEKTGGNGIKFDWENLKWYHGGLPFLLGGGISLQDASLLKELKHKNLIGIDINSKFEISPGIKNIDLIRTFKNKLHDNVKHTERKRLLR
jgi:phosphoribosylanthranilate isomerase